MAEYSGPVNATTAYQQGERACAQLLGVISGITADGQLHDLEIQFLRTWLASNERAGSHWVGDRIAAQIDRIMADGVVTDVERQELMDALQSVAGMDFPATGSVTAEPIAFPADTCEVLLDGAVVCLTGKFHFGTRGECEAASMTAGAECADSVTTKVKYLVIGSAGATESWKQASYGNKIDAAMKLKEKGHTIFVLTEEAWELAL